MPANYKLDEVIREYIIESGEQEQKHFRFMQMGISGLRELHMDVSGTPSVVTLDITDIDTVNLPSDYIKYTKIGVCDCNGNLIQLGVNSDACLIHDRNDCGSYVKTTEGCPNCSCDDCDGGCSPTGGSSGGYGALSLYGWDGYSDNFRNGECMGRFFGLGGGYSQAGYYKINNDLGVMQIQGRCGDSIVMEYIGDISVSNGDFNVHPYLVETIKRWISWRKVIDNTSIGLGEKQLREKAYNLARRQAIKRFNGSTLNEWRDALRRYNMQSPKF